MNSLLIIDVKKTHLWEVWCLTKPKLCSSFFFKLGKYFHKFFTEEEDLSITNNPGLKNHISKKTLKSYKGILFKLK